LGIPSGQMTRSAATTPVIYLSAIADIMQTEAEALDYSCIATGGFVTDRCQTT
jgi:hypothetical protein